MNGIRKSALLLFFLTSGFCLHAQMPPPDDCTNCLFLNSWSFWDSTNWSSDAPYPAIAFTNIVNLPGEDGNILLLDTTNTAPAFLFYNIVETNEDSTTFTNLTLSEGTIDLWFNPTNWSSSNQGGTGPGAWANLISLGEYGTNGSSWWAWYISPDGNMVYLASQTNGGSPSLYLAAPVSFVATNWYNLALTYSATNTAFYTNAVLVTNGTGVEYWPGPDVTFFAMGSDTNGYYQMRGMLSDVETFNYEMDTNSIQSWFGMLSLFYGTIGDGYQAQGNAISNASAAMDPAPDWFGGLGDLSPEGTDTAICGYTNVNVWITNVSAALQTNGMASITFTIAGGTSNSYYDVFGISSFPDPVTNSVWAWLGQGQTCHIYTISNLPNTSAFLMLGKPQDSDGDGLTDAFELLVSHTSPYTNSTFSGLPDAWVAINGLVGSNGLAGADPDMDGLTNWQEYLYGTKPLVPEGITPWVGTPSGYSGIP